MPREDPESIICRNLQRQEPDYAPTDCIFDHKKNCFTILNTFNSERFHCLYAASARVWRSHSLTNSCDMPDHFYDLLLLNQQLGDEYVLPFASLFREPSGYTIAMFRQETNLYQPNIIDRGSFKQMVFAMVVLYVAVGWRIGGVPPEVKSLSFAYTKEHPVLCNLGKGNANKKILIHGKEQFTRKRWGKFLRGKKLDGIIQQLKTDYPRYFQRKRPGKQCILNESGGDTFDDLTHSLLCRKRFLIDVLQDFKELMPDLHIRDTLIPLWVSTGTLLPSPDRVPRMGLTES